MELISPAGTVVITDRPEFHWTPLPGQWTYRVRIYSPGFQAVAESPDVTNPVWRPGAPLPSGVTLEWQVTAASGQQRITFPQPPLLPPRFRVADAATVTRIQQLVKQPGITHLMLGIVYGESGMLDEARRELTEAVRAQPNSRDLTKLLDSLNVRP